MSDSDDNLTQHNMFENENTTLRGQSSFFNQRFKNLASSTHTSMLQNMNSGYGFNPRNMQSFNRRETSPMSLRSVPDFGHANYENSIYSRGRACESVINGRSQSPGSVGSMDSTTSAVYVAQIFKNMKFNKYDKRIIHEAYNKYFRSRERRRVGKRRKLKLFIKRNRRKSDDSGDDGSNSSMSSDDNRSVRSAIPKESILRPNFKSNRAEILNFRETMKQSDMYTDCTENLRNNSFKNKFQDSNVKPTLQLTNNVDMTRDCTATSAILPERVNNYQTGMGTQRGRFTKGYTLPSERFNRPVLKPTSNRSMLPPSEKISLRNQSDDSDSDSDIFPNQTVLNVNSANSRKRSLDNHESTILSNEKRNKLSCDAPSTNLDDVTFKKPQMPVRRPVKAKANFLSGPITSKSKYPLLGFLSHSMSKDRENTMNVTKKPNETITDTNHLKRCEEVSQKPIDSESDDIFTPNTLTNTNKQQKPDKKDKNDNKISPKNKAKVGRKSLGKKSETAKNRNHKNIQDKSPQAKNKVNAAPTENIAEEILISKSKQPLTGNVEVINPLRGNKSQPKGAESEKVSDDISDLPSSITDMSMKPSFIKRKLFTQKLDIAEDKNASVDSLVANSPHPVHKLRERNKVRKLATSQSCLSRDIAGGDNNILDLIHKIVPANQMNLTSANNQKTRNSSQENEDKWDVTSVISMCNRTNESDTFTDEDIFQANNAPKNNNKSKKSQTAKINEKQSIEPVNVQKVVHSPVNKIECTKNTVANYTTLKPARPINEFWDTDLEGNLDDVSPLPVRFRAKNTGKVNRIEIANKENIQKSNLVKSPPTDVDPKNAGAQCKVVLMRSTDVQNYESEKRIPEKKNKTVNKRPSPKKDKCVDSKEVNNVKNDLKDNAKRKIKGKDEQKPLKEKPKNDIKTRSSPRTQKAEVKNITIKSDVKLNKNEPKRQSKTSKKVLQENRIVGTVMTRKQKSFLNDSLNSSCERSILTRSFRIQTKQRLL